MKKLLLLFFAFTLVGTVSAQDTMPVGKNSTEKKAQKPPNKRKDMVMMKNGSMVMLKDGEWMPMKKKMTLNNGTKVKPDGSVTFSDGTKMTMQNADRIDIDGTLILGKRSPVMKKDSTMKK